MHEPLPTPEVLTHPDPESLSPYWDPDHLPSCIDCKIFLRAIPISATEIYYFCRGCHANYTVDSRDFGKRPLPPEFQHCQNLPKELYHHAR